MTIAEGSAAPGTPAMRVYYDGECPFCASYVKMARLRQAVGDVVLVDARTAPEAVSAFASAGYDIDQGMIVELDGRVYFGWEAVWAINALAARAPLLRRLTSRRLLKAVYPALRGSRNLVLRLLGRQPIGSGRRR